MDTTTQQAEDGAAFDLVRGSVNLMLAGMLIAWGTSMKLPLSTTFVTFMVAMGTSLADRAWGRESAVFRITGVISVIGGWFITAGVAFIGAGLVVALMHKGGVPVMVAGGIISVAMLIRSNRQFRKKKKETQSDTLFQTILATDKPSEVWPLLRIYINEKQKQFLNFGAKTYQDVITGFITDTGKKLSGAEKALITEKDTLKNQRRKLTICLRKATAQTIMEKSTWFHLSNDMAMSITYNLRRINEVCKEHVDNNFTPLPQQFHKALSDIGAEVHAIFINAIRAVDDNNPELIDTLRKRCEKVKLNLSKHAKAVYEVLQTGDASNLTVAYVYLNLLQESQELVTSLRKMLRAIGKLNLEPSQYRSFSQLRPQY